MLVFGTTTLLRWLKIPEFKDEYLKARREAVELQVGALNNGVPKIEERRIPAISRSSPRNSGDRGQRRRSEYGLNARNFAEFR